MDTAWIFTGGLMERTRQTGSIKVTDQNNSIAAFDLRIANGSFFDAVSTDSTQDIRAVIPKILWVSSVMVIHCRLSSRSDCANLLRPS
jgi:hypothetical protein